jgi:hypothetical protein
MHLKQVLEMKAKITADWDGERYRGITSNGTTSTAQ